MSISSLTSKIVYVGTGSTAAAAKVFSYPFKILAATDLTVSEYNNTTSAAIVKTLSTHYDVSGVGSSGGGNVTITGSYTNLPVGCQLVIQRVMDLTQETDYVENDAFSAETHETALDRLTMISQQLQEQLDRAVLADITQTSPDLDVIANANSAKSSAVVAMAQAVLSSAYAGATTTYNPTFTGLATMATANITTLTGVYSEGKWAASLLASQGSITLNAAYTSGRYIKVGKMVTLTGFFSVASVSSPAGTLTVGGIPFACGTGNEYTAAVAVNTNELGVVEAPIIAHIDTGVSIINIDKLVSGAATALAGDVAASSRFDINVTYFTD
jgi:hypothetical protein